MEELIILAFDLGASSGRAMIGKFDLKEKKMTIEELYRFPNMQVRVGRGLYWDVLRIWEEVKTGLRKAGREFGERLSSIGVDTWGVDFALLDDNGELLGNPHTYRDPRTEGIMEEVFKLVSREEIYSKTGIQFMRINTLYQLYSMAKMGSPQLKIAKTFLMVPDLFNYWLSEREVSEYTEASTTQFVNPRSRSWCFDLLEVLGIPTEIFPEMVEPGVDLGKISREVSEELEVPREVSVIAPATHDTASAIAAAPIDGSSGYVSSGTWSLVGLELKEPLINDRAMRYNFTNEGGAFGTITFLRNIQGMWFLQEVKRILEQKGETYDYGELTKLAANSRPFIAFIDPDDPRFLAPTDMIEEILKYLEETKQERPKNLGELVRIVLESLAMKYRLVFEQARELTGKKIERINIFGGGSKNWLLNQLVADFMNVPVLAGPEEATSIGNVLLQAAGLGVIKSLEELREVVTNSFELRTYHPNHTVRHEDAYSAFLSLIEKEEESK